VSSVKEQLNTLVELQDTEVEIKSLERELAGIGARVEAMLAEKATYEQKLQDSRDKLEGLKKQYRSDESEIQMIDNQIVKSKEKLRAVKTNKEYQSTLKEIDDLKAKASTVEDGMLDTLDKIEAVESEIALQLSDLEDVAQEVAGKQEEIREQGKKQEKALALLYGQRDAILAGTDEKLKEFYGKVKRQNAGIALVAIIDTVCQQCRMNIPPQLFNDLMRMDSLMMCPHCQRIMYPKDLLFE
jgi:predicted  nucleic acid-binding Zn-ribbon protein